MSATDRVARINNAPSEQRYVATQIVAAIEGCKAGNPTDCEWIHRRGIDFLCLICPADRDVNVLVANLLPVRDVQLRLGV